MNLYTKAVTGFLTLLSLGTTTPAFAMNANDIKINVDGVWSFVHDPGQIGYTSYKTDGKPASNYYDSYARITMKGKFDENFSFQTRLHSGYYDVGDSLSAGPTKDKNGDLKYESTSTYFDQAFISYRKPDSQFRITAGMQGMYMGQGLVWDATGNFDGISAHYGDWWKHGNTVNIYYGDRKTGESVKAIDVTSWVSPKIQLSAMYVNFTANGNPYYNTPMYYNVPGTKGPIAGIPTITGYNTANDKIFALGTQVKMGPVTLVAEKSHNTKEKKSDLANGYYAEAYTGPTADFTSGLPLEKVGTSVTALTYQDIGKYSVEFPEPSLFQGKKGASITYGQVLAKGLAGDIQLAAMENKDTHKNSKLVKAELAFKF